MAENIEGILFKSWAPNADTILLDYGLHTSTGSNKSWPAWIILREHDISILQSFHNGSWFAYRARIIKSVLRAKQWMSMPFGFKILNVLGNCVYAVPLVARGGLFVCRLRLGHLHLRKKYLRTARLKLLKSERAAV